MSRPFPPKVGDIFLDRSSGRAYRYYAVYQDDRGEYGSSAEPLGLIADQRPSLIDRLYAFYCRSRGGIIWRYQLIYTHYQSEEDRKLHPRRTLVKDIID
jgi:hypothetical protein